MNCWQLWMGVLLFQASSACIRQAPQPEPVYETESWAASAAAAAPTPEGNVEPLPLDDPNSCIDPSLPPGAAQVAAAEERPAIEAELERRILEKSAAFAGCWQQSAPIGELELELNVGADGTSRVKVLETGVEDCAVVNCIRHQLTGMQVAPPRAERRVFWRQRLAVAGAEPMRLTRPPVTAGLEAAPKANTSACLDGPSPEADPTLDLAAAQPIFAQARARFRDCYKAGLARNRDLQGKLSLRFVVARDGTVSNAAIVATDLPNCSVSRCIRDAMYPLQFPPPSGGSASVVIPIRLVPR